MANFRELYDRFENTPEYIASGIQLDVALAVEGIMERREMSNTDLADSLHCSKAYVTKVLRGDCNFSILSLSKIACALDSDLRIHIEPREPKKAVIKQRVSSMAADFARKIINNGEMAKLTLIDHPAGSRFSVATKYGVEYDSSEIAA